MNMSLGDFAAMASIGALGACVLFWALRGRLGSVFVTKAEHEDTVGRLKSIEVKLELVPTHEDFKAVNTGVHNVALQMATVTERVAGVTSSLGRIERTLQIFADARLQWEKER